VRFSWKKRSGVAPRTQDKCGDPVHPVIPSASSTSSPPSPIATKVGFAEAHPGATLPPARRSVRGLIATDGSAGNQIQEFLRPTKDENQVVVDKTS
jgi:hypothetical protein